MSQLANALFTTTQQKVLGLLYTQPDQSFYTREILKKTGMGVATIKRELDRMVAAGILTMTPVGNQHHYQANRGCPIYEELAGIVRKTFGVADLVRAALTPLSDKIGAAFIYGSFARGEETTNSDIDLMIIADNLAYSDAVAALEETESQLGRPVNPSIYEQEQVSTKLAQRNAFLTRVMEQPKLWVKGSEDDLEVFRKPGGHS